MDIFKDIQSASLATARMISDALGIKLSTHERASLMVSGGSTPLMCFKALSKSEVIWSRVDITLTDERDVPRDHPASNEKMIREHLLVANASRANFVALNTGNIQTLHPFACTLVGMGEDGHFASLFPDSPELEEGLNSESETVKVTTPSSDYNRTSATLNTISDSDLIILLIFGNVKKNIVEAPAGYPINHVLSQEQTPVRIIWAPT
jgi:6-phosphogluconolactonase